MRQPDRTTTPGNRTVKHRWELGTTSDDGFGEQLRDIRVLSCGHDTDRKHFYAQLYPAQTNGQIERFAMFSGATVLREPVARFSQKRFDEFVQRALKALETSDDAKVVELRAPIG